MRTPTASAVAAAFASSGLASAQSFTTDSTITMTLVASEAPGGNGNGVIEPGESALIRINEAFSNQNTIGHFAPPIGTFGSGTIRGFGSAWLDLNGSGGTTGSWDVDPNHGNGPQGIWDIAGAWGTVSGGNLVNIQLGQFAQFVSTQNPVVPMWQGVWTPSDYSARTVSWNLAPNSAAGQLVAAVILKLTNTLFAGTFVDAQHLILGGTEITIAPAPGTVGWLGAGGLIVVRGRRRPRRSGSWPALKMERQAPVNGTGAALKEGECP